MIKGQRAAAAMINETGRQRMLSQRVTLLLHGLRGPAEARFPANLGSALGSLRSAAEKERADPESMSPAPDGSETEERDVPAGGRRVVVLP